MKADEVAKLQSDAVLDDLIEYLTCAVSPNSTAKDAMEQIINFKQEIKLHQTLNYSQQT
ncbi:hypothetical protein [Xenorhabdus sp. TH1]|uniref:hypothetical protein n=1 Tax=Xenorhabdus sp. TH1 TaxID=3130166 RepID=UPI0030D1C471